MRASHLLLGSIFVLGALAAAGCSVPPFEVDPAFDQRDSSVGDSTIDGGADVTDTFVEETLPPGTCKTNLDCVGLGPERKCNTATSKCVECLLSEDCAGASYCVSNACVPGCKADSDCVGAKPGDPVGDAGKADAKTDTGGDAAAATKMKCDTARRVCIGCITDDECNPGYVCNASTGTTEGDAGSDAGSDAATDAATDGGTTNGGACVPGCTPSHACQTGLDCCVGKCISTKADSKNCGACGKVCDTLAHTTIACEDSACKVTACDTGWKDCSGGVADGCETDILNSLATCGGCGTPCTIANGSGKCEGGLCKVASCDAGWDNCDGKDSTGCEAPLTSTTNCGKCGQACTVTNGTGTCGDGTCKILSCNSGFKDCDAIAATGCEINTNNNPNACGSCTNVCPSTGGTPQCTGGVCGYSSCTTGFGDCTGSGTCSTPVTNDVNNCGACGRTCSYANATPKCTGTSCGIDSCSTGWGNCNGILTDGCERPLDTLTDCGGCGTPCSRAHATASCSTLACKTGTCDTGWGNCDTDDTNGCEKNLTGDVSNCGACGTTCSVPNATAACTASKCVVGTCSAGFANCDGDPTTNGCERDVTKVNNTCATATALADGGGATSLCADKTSVTTVGVGAYGTSYYKITLTHCAGGPCKSADPMRVKLNLQSPAGMAFDLRVFPTNSCTLADVLGTSASGALGALESVTWTDAANACTSPITLYVEVKYRSGQSCGAPTLTAQTYF